MCLAISVVKGYSEDNIEEIAESIENAWVDNPDGGGYAYANDGEIVIRKGYMNMEKFIEDVTYDMLSRKDTGFIIHLRFASAGEITDDNTHPFLVGETAMIHNGTIKEFDKGKANTKSDTQLFAEFASTLPSDFLYYDGFTELIEDFIGYSKLAFIDKRGNTFIYNAFLGEYSGNIWYSNDYYKKDVSRKQTSTDRCYSCNAKLTKDEINYGLCNKCEAEYWDDYYYTKGATL